MYLFGDGVDCCKFSVMNDSNRYYRIKELVLVRKWEDGHIPHLQVSAQMLSLQESRCTLYGPFRLVKSINVETVPCKIDRMSAGTAAKVENL